MKKNLFNIILTAVFIFFLSLSFIGLFLGMTSKIDNTEWRRLAQFPVINDKMKIDEFPKKFEQFYNDNFGFRNILLILDATIEFELFKKSPVAAVIRTANGWYFHNEARFMAPAYKYYYHHITLSNKLLSWIGDNFLDEKKYLDGRRIPYLFVVVPDKEIVYPEYFPYPNFINSNIQLSLILNALKKREIPVLYLGSQIVDTKKNTDIPLYWKEDAHWNSFGAFIGYQAIISRLKDHFPNIDSLQLSDFNISINSQITNAHDLNRLKSLIHGSDNSKEPIVNFTLKDGVLSRINKINKVLIYADSYFVGAPPEYIGGAMYFLKYHFDNIILHNDPLWGLEKTKVEEEKPDLVIREIIQRNLYKYYAGAGAEVE